MAATRTRSMNQHQYFLLLLGRRETTLASTSPFLLPFHRIYRAYSHSSSSNHGSQRQPDQHLNEGSPSIGSPSRVQKLIASQTDPLLAKEIFDLASRQPNFQHSYASYHTLILKLGRSYQFSLMQDVISLLKVNAYHYPSIPSSLFSQIIQIYGDAKLPDKVLKSFHMILEFNIKPTHKHLNSVLQILVAHRENYLRSAFDLFKSSPRYGVFPDTQSYNILIRAFCLNDDLSIAYALFGKMLKRDVLPDVESYHVLIIAFCRKSQVNKAVEMLEDMLNKGFVPDSLSYTTLLNSLCRKKKLKEAYKLLCKMKVKGCKPDIVHYNTVIVGFCREGRPHDACKVLEDMISNKCLPNLVSYRALVGGLCNQGMYAEAMIYMEEMLSKGYSPHFSVVHALVRGYINGGKIEEACVFLENMLAKGEIPHVNTWSEIVPRICEVEECTRTGNGLEKVLKVEVGPNTRIVDAASGLENYVISRIRRVKPQVA